MDRQKLMAMIEKLDEITSLPPHRIDAITTRIKQKHKSIELVTIGELIELSTPHLENFK